MKDIQNKFNAPRYRNATIVFLGSLLSSLTIGFHGTRMGGLSGQLVCMERFLGLISVVTVPMAWRWVYLRQTR
ncbi:hypothetical protein SAMN05428989_2405 [Pseudoxanthomonas sp. GM95]|uniref:hypothetical protein n=1 Tax=Pseudoxanthomonas sp. GM95 TaxID=1881043 RepID=UPI0008CEB77F|nr:hypothetical protein [Pseudoxanthomonas sp. GM95]SEL74917.1 hypothetical protein SAMN05428989_2405 [Pseudoxanthomonas sp. GM95]